MAAAKSKPPAKVYSFPPSPHRQLPDDDAPHPARKLFQEDWERRFVAAVKVADLVDVDDVVTAQVIAVCAETMAEWFFDNPRRTSSVLSRTPEPPDFVPKAHRGVITRYLYEADSEAPTDVIKCPGCELVLAAADLDGQIAHMKAEHPDIVDDRLEELDRTAGWVDE